MSSVALYVADLYEWHQNGATMERIVQEIMHRLDAIVRSECFEKSKDLEDYEKIKDDLFIRLLNVEKNRAELDDAIFRTIGDIALVLYARMGELDGCSTSVKIKQHIFEKWDKVNRWRLMMRCSIHILFHHRGSIAGKN